LRRLAELLLAVFMLAHSLHGRPRHRSSPIVAIGMASSVRVGAIALQECDRRAGWRGSTESHG
jgi:hypothetical protein